MEVTMPQLINFLKTNKNTRKIFGKKELKIIEKQLMGVSLTQSEKNRLSRDIRKKFEFINEITKINEEFRLKKGEEIEDLIEKTLDLIRNSEWFFKMEKIILFGSTVENQRVLRSDIDIAVIFKDLNHKEMTKFRIWVAGRADKKIDIQVYNLLPKKIQEEINKKGKTLFKK
ncbi:MAG: nucleotidyltransferase domain-containing protein [Nanoarchaeota archaeon]